METSRRGVKVLIVLEVIVCFGPLFFILLLGLAALPSLLLQMWSYGTNTLPFVALITGGAAGMFGVALLLSRYFRSDRGTALRRTMIVCLGSGFASFASYA